MFSALRAVAAPGLAWDLKDVHNRSLGVHTMLHRADAKNREILHLFHRVAGPNRTVFRNTFGSELESNTLR